MPELQLYPYQAEAAELMSRAARLYLADDPGLGKTRTALYAARLAGAERVAVVCPAIVRPHWRREADVVFGEGAIPERVVSYNAVVSNAALRDELRAWKPDVLILDEAHFLKHHTSKRTKLLVGSGGLAQQVPQVWPLSGTPMPRNPLELHPILAGLWPKVLAERGLLDRWRWLNHFCHWKQTEYGIKVYAARNVPELRELLAPLMVRRTVQQVLPELPALRWGVVNLELAEQDQRSLEQAENQLGFDFRAYVEVRGALPPLDENLSRYRHALGDFKAPLAAELIAAELDGSEGKLVVYAYHRSVLDVLERTLRLFGVVRIDGSTCPEDREAAISRFQHGDARVFVGQIDACSTGITLHAAHDVVLVEASWSADVNVQAAKRCHRIGQTDSVLARFIQIENTLDEAIVQQHTREAEMVARVLDDGTH